MRVLHTADIHLREDEPRTVEALDAVLTKGADHGVDVVTIAGDLFHSPADADALRPQLRASFSDNPFDILVIPGNHDVSVFERNLDFGRDVDVMVDSPFETRSYGEVDVVGVPYTERLTDDLFEALAAASDDDQTRCLLLHCTLDIGFGAGEVGDEDAVEYFPVSKATLAGLGFDVVLAGHIHATTRQVPLPTGGTFVYPGSPVSHSTKETGRRHAVLVDPGRGNVESIPLDTHYVDRFEATVRPGEESETLAAIEEWVDEREDDECELYVEVDGFTQRAETAFHEALDGVSGPARVTSEVKGATAVLQHPLYRRFVDELDREDDLPDREAVETRVVRVMAELLARREIRP